VKRLRDDKRREDPWSLRFCWGDRGAVLTSLQECDGDNTKRKTTQGITA